MTTTSGSTGTIAREGHPASRKTYLAGSREDLRVPMREVGLTNADTVVLYDTSGPYTDPGHTVDLHAGLPRLREPWILERGDTETYGGTGAAAFDMHGQPRTLRRAT